jgi:hypothetical protein
LLEKKSVNLQLCFLSQFADSCFQRCTCLATRWQSFGKCPLVSISLMDYEDVARIIQGENTIQNL